MAEKCLGHGTKRKLVVFSINFLIKRILNNIWQTKILLNYISNAPSSRDYFLNELIIISYFKSSVCRLTYLQAEASSGNWVKFSLTHRVPCVQWSVHRGWEPSHVGDKSSSTEVTTIYKGLSPWMGCKLRLSLDSDVRCGRGRWDDMCVAREILMPLVNVSTEGLTQIKYLRLRTRTKRMCFVYLFNRRHLKLAIPQILSCLICHSDFWPYLYLSTKSVCNEKENKTQLPRHHWDTRQGLDHTDPGRQEASKRLAQVQVRVLQSL